MHGLAFPIYILSSLRFSSGGKPEAVGIRNYLQLHVFNWLGDTVNRASPGRKPVQYNEKYLACVRNDPSRYHSTLDDGMLVVFVISETKKKRRVEVDG